MDTLEARHLVRSIQKKAPTIFNIEYANLKDLVPLAAGNFGEVYCGYYKKQKVAVKKLIDVDDEKMHKYLEREIITLKDVRHPNIIEFLGLCKHSSGLYLVTEFAQGGDLRKVLKNKSQELSWPNRLHIALDVCSAMAFLHSKSIVHRDLKSHNVLVYEDSNAKVCDFGFSRKLPEGKRKRDRYMSVCGTDQWMAPEVLLGDPYNEKADVFSYAMFITELITREKPPERVAPTMYAFDMIEFRNKCPADTPKELIDIVGQCSNLSQSRRPPLSDIERKLASLVTPNINMTKLSFSVDDLNIESTVQAKQHVWAKVIINYTARDTVELSLRKGERVLLLQTDESGWCEGQLGNLTGWFPNNVIAREVASTEPRNRNNSVDAQSLTSMEHRSAANQNLMHFLNSRPAPEFLAERNILQNLDSQPAEFYSAKKSLEKKKKIDTLSNFFRKKVVKKKSEDPDIFVEESLVDQIILTLYSTDRLIFGSHKYNHNSHDDCFLSGDLEEILVELRFFPDNTIAKKFIIYAIKRNIFRSVEPTFDSYTPKLPLRLQMQAVTIGVMNDIKYYGGPELNALEIVQSLLREIQDHAGLNWPKADIVKFSLACTALQKANLSVLSPLEKQLFFLNLYNVMRRYFSIRFGVPANYQMQLQQETKNYFIVDSTPYSLDIIKKNILYGLVPFANEADPRKEHVVSANPMTYFVLLDARYEHGDPTYVFSVDSYQELLSQLLESYFASAIKTEAGVITCDRLIKEYADNFYGTDVRVALTNIVPYAPKDLASQLANDNVTFRFSH